MIVLYTDLDNTLIYSYKHDIGIHKKNVEIYQGREISFVTENTWELLQELNQKLCIVPTTTRTIEQYNRIQLNIGNLPYALVCNGGILLVNGKKDENWYQESLQRIRPSYEEMLRARELLQTEKRRKFELRFIENLFLFTKCEQPEVVVKKLKNCLNIELVDIFYNKEKVYVLPKGLSKGDAVSRLKKLLRAEKTLAAGDSAFDKSMLEQADYAFAPYGYQNLYGANCNLWEPKDDLIFSEEYLKECKRLIHAKTDSTSAF